MNKKQLIKKAIQERKDWLKMKKTIERFPDNFPYCLRVWIPKHIEIDIEKIEQLHDLRNSLRDIFGSWPDKIDEIWPFNKEDIQITWSGRFQGIKITINYYCTKDTMPEGIQKPGCKMVVEGEKHEK